MPIVEVLWRELLKFRGGKFCGFSLSVWEDLHENFFYRLLESDCFAYFDSFNVNFKNTGEENLLPSVIPLRSDEDFLVCLLQINFTLFSIIMLRVLEIVTPLRLWA